MKYARIEYTHSWKKHTSAEEKEGFVIWLKDEEEDWGLMSFFPLVHRKNAGEWEDANFIHFSIIRKIQELIELGYKIEF